MILSFCLLISRIIIKRVESYIDSPDLIKNKNATINPIGKNDNKCFQYAATVALIYKKIGKIFEE